jgi:hypothetical protein
MRRHQTNWDAGYCALRGGRIRSKRRGQIFVLLYLARRMDHKTASRWGGGSPLCIDICRWTALQSDTRSFVNSCSEVSPCRFCAESPSPS